MRTKHLLWALALPSVFAACTQDEFTEQAQGTIDNRPVVGAISLDIAENPATRWGYEGGFTFDDNDYIGAALMDIYTSTETSWDAKYDLVDYIQTNYRYGYKDGWTNNDAIMSEGNYFFYLPYNDQLKSRTGLPLNVPAEQFAYDPEAETPVADDQYAWKKHQIFLGYDDVKVDDQQAVPNLVEVFAKPRFNINYKGNSNVVVERVVVNDATGEFSVENTLQPKTGTNTSEYNPIAKKASAPAGTSLSTAATTFNSNNKVVASSNLAKVFQAYNKALDEYTLGEYEEFVSPLYGDNKYLKAGKKVDFMSLTFVPAKEVTGLMVMPAGEHTATNVTIEVYTSKGLVTITGLSNFNDVTTAAAQTGLTYSNLKVLADIKAGDGTKANAITINFNDVDIKQPAAVSVSTTSQLESIIRWYEDPDGDYSQLTGTPKELTITVNGDVEFTQTVYNAIKGNPNISFKFVVTADNSLIIPADLASDALSLISKESTGNITVKGTQNLSNTSNAAVVYKYDITVDANATLNVNGGSKGITLQNVTNKGAVKVDGTVTVYTGKKISNNKDITVNADATLTAKILNNVDSKTAGTVITYTQNAKIVNNGTLDLLTDSKNQSIIENNNKLYITGAFTNEAEAKGPTTNGYTGLIQNLDVNTSYIYAQKTFTNNGTVENYGAMYSQGVDGSIVNAGTIKAKDGATTYVTSNTGEIELEKRSTETTVDGNDKGTISYVMTAGDLTNGAFTFDKATDKFNTLKVGMNVKFNNGGDYAPESLILAATSTISVVCASPATNPQAYKFKSITAEGGARYSIQGTEIATEKLTVNAGAVFQIPALSSFGVYGTSTSIDNEGEILVGGTFYSNITPQPSGTWSKAGSGSYTWGDTNYNWGKQSQLP